jgi:hypothetical protein
MYGRLNDSEQRRRVLPVLGSWGRGFKIPPSRQLLQVRGHITSSVSGLTDHLTAPWPQDFGGFFGTLCSPDALNVTFRHGYRADNRSAAR